MAAVRKGTTDNEERDEQIKRYEERLDKMEDTNQRILEMVTELKIGVCGSDQIGVDGIITKVKKVEDYIEKDKRDKYRFAGAVSAISFVIGLGMSLLAIFIKSKNN